MLRLWSSHLSSRASNDLGADSSITKLPQSHTSLSSSSHSSTRPPLLIKPRLPFTVAAPLARPYSSDCLPPSITLGPCTVCPSYGRARILHVDDIEDGRPVHYTIERRMPGTQNLDTVRIPILDILDYVSDAELERFETARYKAHVLELGELFQLQKQFEAELAMNSTSSRSSKSRSIDIDMQSSKTDLNGVVGRSSKWVVSVDVPSLKRGTASRDVTESARETKSPRLIEIGTKPSRQTDPSRLSEVLTMSSPKTRSPNLTKLETNGVHKPLREQKMKSHRASASVDSGRKKVLKRGAPSRETQLEDVVSEDVEYEIERFTADMLVDGIAPYYCVKWFGYEDVSWEPYENVKGATEALEEYHARKLVNDDGI